MIKWFSKLSDTYQEVRQGHKQEGAECASCWPAVLYWADSYKSLTHTHTVSGRNVFPLESYSSRLSGKTKAVRADNIMTACSPDDSALIQIQLSKGLVVSRGTLCSLHRCILNIWQRILDSRGHKPQIIHTKLTIRQQTRRSWGVRSCQGQQELGQSPLLPLNKSA